MTEMWDWVAFGLRLSRGVDGWVGGWVGVVGWLVDENGHRVSLPPTEAGEAAATYMTFPLKVPCPWRLELAD